MKSVFICLSAIMFVQAASAAEIFISFDGHEKFAQTAGYTIQDRKKITSEIQDDIAAALIKNDVDVARIDVNIIQAKPNSLKNGQPNTRGFNTQVRAMPAKSGMWLEGTAYDADGNILATYEYQGIQRNEQRMTTTHKWSDAFRASDRFARKLVDKL